MDHHIHRVKDLTKYQGATTIIVTMSSRKDQNANNRILSEINQSEEKRASTIRGNSHFQESIRTIRQKYIVDGFLQPFYAPDGRYSRSRYRVNELGNFILPEDIVGKVFNSERLDRLHNEEIWFWLYLVNDLGIISSRAVPATHEANEPESRPANLIWQEISTVISDLQLAGESGGGVFESEQELDCHYLAKLEQQPYWLQGDNGYVEKVSYMEEPLWSIRFRHFKMITQNYPQSIDLFPAWFRITDHLFFDTPLDRLSVFSAVFNPNGSLNRLRFLNQELSGEAREFIGTAMFSIPSEFRKTRAAETTNRERRNMTWWLWHRVGHSVYRRPLTYREIADLAPLHRSTVQSGIKTFDKKLRGEFGKEVLRNLLVTARDLGIGYRMVYNHLADEGIAPPRDLDDFNLVEIFS